MTETSTTRLHRAPDRAEAARAAGRAFADAFGTEADGVFSAPGRVTIIGEHVDYQDGLCLPMAIGHRCFAAVRVTETGRLQLRSRQMPDDAVDVALADLAPGAVPVWAGYAAGVIWALADAHPQLRSGELGLAILVDGQVPLGAGLSSSAALECSVAQALEELLGLGTTQQERIAACIRAENEFVGAATGGLDQSASVRAAQGHALLLDCADGAVELEPWDLSEHGLGLLIVDTRAEHSLIGGEYAERRGQTESAAEALGAATLREVADAGADGVRDQLDALEDDVIRRRARHVVTEICRVREFADLLADGGVGENLRRLGELMNASHDSLRDDFEVTVPELDVAVGAARDAGAHGARMTGGGFGGSIIALVDADQMEATAAAVATAFAEHGFTAPVAFAAQPSAGAGRDI
ncbi:galactokinase [Helcobacillus massiliensis]|uniref:galactokinase n=1 Tax=Helcobacillus massiliensis TaxID=521392 RepID=UPI0021A7407A|nr:galactokinase [Helcobacillus massiliensis]MCT1558330.1 galactokinase [Helcobacillus massiliensis]MCT2037321.1 galactokinase [Helcobacillus massiliensis]MCT2332341.1 galactokinase [Helcobacillus massiliensis]